MKKFIKKFIDVFTFCLGIKDSGIEKEAIKNNLVSRDGQGRDKYGN